MRAYGLSENSIVSYGINMVKLLPEIRAGGGEICFGRHWHERMEFIRIREGGMKVILDDAEFSARDGELIIIEPHKIHSAIADEGGAVYDCIMFDVRNFYNGTPAAQIFLEPVFSHSVEFICRTDDADTVGTFDAIARLDGDDSPAGCLQSVGLVYRFVSLLYEKCISESCAMKLADKKFSEVIDYVNANFTERLSTSELCAKFGYSESYFCRRFKSATGFTVLTYIKILRLEHAKKLLRETALPISRISWMCGFADERNFANTFREHYSVSPSRFRKEYTEKR